MKKDVFATERGHDLRNGLVKLHNENLSIMIPDPLYSAYHFSHPHIIERLKNVEKLLEKYKKEN